MFGGGKGTRRSGAERMNQPSVMNMTIDFNESVFGATKVNFHSNQDCLVSEDNNMRNLQRRQVQTRDDSPEM